MRYYKTKKSSLTKSNAYAACMRKLNYRDYSYNELSDFLKEHNELDCDFIDELLTDFVDSGYINDNRFAGAIFASWLYDSHKGKYYLLMKLRKHKISENIVNEYRDMDLQEIELSKASNLLDKYISIRHLDLNENRMKILNYLKNQYYTSGTINRAINGYNPRKT